MNITTREACTVKLLVILFLLCCAAALYAKPTDSIAATETGHTHFENNLSGCESKAPKSKAFSEDRSPQSISNLPVPVLAEPEKRIREADGAMNGEARESTKKHAPVTESRKTDAGLGQVEIMGHPRGGQFISNVASPERLLTPVESFNKERIVVNLGIEYEQVPYNNSIFIHSDLPLYLSPISRARNIIIP